MISPKTQSTIAGLVSETCLSQEQLTEKLQPFAVKATDELNEAQAKEFIAILSTARGEGVKKQNVISHDETPTPKAPPPNAAPPPNMAAPKMRQIVIETDGNGVKIVSAQVSGSLELRAILSILLDSLNKK